jgi:hypothetical protein
MQAILFLYRNDSNHQDNVASLEIDEKLSQRIGILVFGVGISTTISPE